MTEPTDAEILALNAGEIHFSESPTKYPEYGHGTQYHAGAPGVLSFARAVLAKWGTPAVAGEPVAWMGVHDNTDLYYRKPPQADVVPLYTTPQPTQAQAGAAPLTDEMQRQMKERCDSYEMRGAFADGWLSAEAAHGIKGGQHGNSTT